MAKKTKRTNNKYSMAQKKKAYKLFRAGNDIKTISKETGIKVATLTFYNQRLRNAQKLGVRSSLNTMLDANMLKSTKKPQAQTSSQDIINTILNSMSDEAKADMLVKLMR